MSPTFRSKSLFRMTATVGAIALCQSQAHAETEVSVYSGYQTSPHSEVELVDHANFGTTKFTAGWLGKSFALPPYYGIRATRWNGNWGWGAEFTHSKVYADAETLSKSGFEHLEMTDGVNILTVNAMYRWDTALHNLTPYVGGGVGVAVPHFEATSNSDKTANYQMTGPALRLTAGASYKMNERWSVFGEYQGTYSRNEADFDQGGVLKTNLITNALNIGVSFGF